MRALAILAALVLGAVPAAAEVAVAGATAPAQRVELPWLRDVLLGRITTWSDGTPITLVLFDDPSTSAALLALLNRDLPQLLRGWKRLVYTGGGAMPIVVTSVGAAVAEVARRPGALTILETLPDAPNVRVVYEGKR